MSRNVNAPETEPEESSFELPSENTEHLLQIVDYWDDKDDPNVIVTKLEVVCGDEEGRSLLHRVNQDDSSKEFYYTRCFLKAISEPYKGSFMIEERNWPGRQFYASVIHNKAKNGKTYANIDQYNFEKMVDNSQVPKLSSTKSADNNIAWDE